MITYEFRIRNNSDSRGVLTHVRKSGATASSRTQGTSPRMVILSALEQDHGYPTAEQLYETLRQDHPSLSLSTIYQTLDVFIRTGLCRRVSGPGDRCALTAPSRTMTTLCAVCVGPSLMLTGIRFSPQSLQGTYRMV